MKYIPSILILIIFFTVQLPASPFEPKEPIKSPLKTEIPIKEIISDLNQYIPQQMEAHNICGLSIALIRSNKLVWAKGFGVRNTLIREPVTANTIFEAASFSKPIAAYLALFLTEKKILELDRPLSSYITIGYLPQSPYNNLITLRHILSHTSGMVNNVLSQNKDINFEPGARYSYSGNGFMYYQYVLESIMRKDLDSLANEHIWQPLKMGHSSYVYQNSFNNHIATGHISTLIIILIFIISSLIFSIFIRIAAYIVRKLLKRTTPLLVEDGNIILTISYFLTLFILIVLWGISASLFMTWLIAVIPTALFLNGGYYLKGEIIPGTGLWIDLKTRIISAVYICTILAFVLISLNTSLPVPLRKYSEANAASSLYSTPSDIAKFMIELMDPKQIWQDTRNRMLTPVIRVNEYNSWGLGLGIQHSRFGDSFWQHGLNPDYQHFMAGYSRRGIGIVIMTNSSNGLNAVRNIAHRAMGGEHYSYWIFNE